MRTTEFSDKEYRSMLRFVADKAKITQKPLAVGQVWKQFKKSTKSRRTEGQLANRFRSEIAPQIQKMQQFEMDVKVQILFAMNCPLEEQFLNEILQAQKAIEVDEFNVILTYSNQETGVNLSALNEQGKSLRKWTRGKKRSQRNLNETLDGTLDDDISFLKNEVVTPTSSGGVKKRKLMIKQEPVESEPAPAPISPAPVQDKIEPVAPEDRRAESEDNDDDVQFIETVEFEPLPKGRETSEEPMEVAEFLRYLNVMLMALDNVKLEELRKKVAEAIKEAESKEMMVSMDSLTDLLKYNVILFAMGREKEHEMGYTEDRSMSADYHQVLKLLRITMFRTIPAGKAHDKLWEEIDAVRGHKVSAHYDNLLIPFTDILYTIMNWNKPAGSECYYPNYHPP